MFYGFFGYHYVITTLKHFNLSLVPTSDSMEDIVRHVTEIFRNSFHTASLVTTNCNKDSLRLQLVSYLKGLLEDEHTSTSLGMEMVDLAAILKATAAKEDENCEK